METLGALSLLPPVLAIVLAIGTRQVFLSLLAGIWLGFTILAKWNPLQGTFNTLEGLAGVFSSNYNTKIIIFTLVVGGLIALVQRSGGVDGFVARILSYLEKETGKAADRGQRKKVELLAFATGMVLFIESNISILTVGTLYRPVFDKLKIPREKLAYIADSSSAPSCILLPLNAWGAYIIAEMAKRGVEGGFPELFKALAYNFYPMLVIVIMLYVILSGRGAKPVVSDEATAMPMIEGATPQARNMIIPLFFLIALVPTFLIMTGWEAGGGDLMLALRSGSGGTSILYASSFACIIAALMYKLSGTLRIRESFDAFMKGMAAMLPLAILMVLAFAIGDICDDLGTGQYVADTASGFISPALVPALIFLIACFIAFSTGTSWGTFAIMLGIAIPLANGMGTNMSLAIGAVLGGGIFGDHCSPTSDTSVISSMASASDHIDHIRTQLPYALIGGAITVILYLILGFLGA